MIGIQIVNFKTDYVQLPFLSKLLVFSSLLRWQQPRKELTWQCNVKQKIYSNDFSGIYFHINTPRIAPGVVRRPILAKTKAEEISEIL